MGVPFSAHRNEHKAVLLQGNCVNFAYDGNTGEHTKCVRNQNS